VWPRGGIYNKNSARGTGREKLFGAGARLPDDHRAARFRRLDNVVAHRAVSAAATASEAAASI
jgi:hypothetical protein